MDLSFNTRLIDAGMRAFGRETSGRASGTCEDMLARYWTRFRARLRSFAQSSDRHADLLASFPAAAVAIISRPTGDCSRQEALRLVECGAPLNSIAAVLGLPAWLRKLPPEAFSQPLSEPITGVAHAPGLAPRILNTLPGTASRPDRWLQVVLDACALGDGDLAVWLGSQRIFTGRRIPPVPVLPLALYAWFSLNPDLPPTRLMHRSWDSKMSLGRAAMSTRHWLLRVLQDLCVETDAQANPWSRTCVVEGVEFVPLLTAAAIAEEGIAMAHCVATYVGYVVFGECRLYSIRRAGQRVATMEIRMSETFGQPRVNQIKAHHNGRPPVEIDQAAATWLRDRMVDRASRDAFHRGLHSDAAFQEQVWRPYASRRRPAGETAGLPMPPTVAAMLAELKEMGSLGRS